MIGNVKKLSSNWLGPYEITHISPDGLTYKISNLENPNNYILATVNQIKIFLPSDESLCIDSPMNICLNYLSHKIDNIRTKQLMNLEKKMIENKFTEEEKLRYHELTVLEQNDNDELIKYKSILNNIQFPYEF